MPISVTHEGWAPTPVDYRGAWALQRKIHDEVREHPERARILLLEHAAVYTAGRRTQPQDRPSDGTPVIDVDRGGLLTWHGPGQLVAYPIVALRDPGAIRDYVFRLEEAIIATLAASDIDGRRVEGRAGVWIVAEGQPDRKIAAIGIHVEDGVTMHGLALNVCNELSPYEVIIPCGITDAGVTTMAIEANRELTPCDVAAELERQLLLHLSPAVRGASTDTATTTPAEGVLAR